MSEAPAFSRPLDVRKLPATGSTTRITATPEECLALGLLLKLPAVLGVRCRMEVRPTRDGVHVTGEVSARVTQDCVVSLEPFDSDVTAAIDLHFAREGSASLRPVVEDGEESDPPDLLENDRIDLGVIAAEFLALGLDPWPRKPDAALPEHETGEVTLNPFAVLAGMKRE